jgi:N-acyl-D-aspartate/D-glutamate deacylase
LGLGLQNAARRAYLSGMERKKTTNYVARAMRLANGRFVGYVGQECYGKITKRINPREFPTYVEALAHAQALVVVRSKLGHGSLQRPKI